VTATADFPQGGILVDVSEAAGGRVDKKAPPGQSGWGSLAHCSSAVAPHLKFIALNEKNPPGLKRPAGVIAVSCQEYAVVLDESPDDFPYSRGRAKFPKAREPGDNSGVPPASAHFGVRRRRLIAH
jgi:hypothetical protein